MKAVYIALTAAVLIILIGVTALFLVFKHFSGRHDYYGVYTEGDKYYNAGDYQTAITYYSRLIEMRPYRYEGYEARASAYDKAHQLVPAIRDQSQAIALLETQAGIDDIGPSRLTREQRLAKLPGVRARLYYNRALYYQERNDNKRAIDDFTSLLKYEPNSSDAYWGRAGCYDTLHQYGKALQECNRFVHVSPRKWNAYLLRGQIQEHMGRNSAAAVDLGRAIRLNPGDKQLYQERGNVEEKLRDYADAVHTWRFYLRSNPNDSDALGSCGWDQYLAGDINGAIATDRQSLDLQPVGWVESNLALCYATQGNWPEASAEYKLMKAHASPKDIPSSLDDVHNALKTHPNSDALKKAEALLSS